MYEGAARVHFIFAGKCKKSEMFYITWLNVVGVGTELLHLKQYFLLPVHTFYLFPTVIKGITKTIFN